MGGYGAGQEPLTQLPPSHPPQIPRHGVWGAAGSHECARTGPRSCSFGDLQMFSLTPYVLNVTATNALGTASSLLPFLLENISECPPQKISPPQPPPRCLTPLPERHHRG